MLAQRPALTGAEETSANYPSIYIVLLRWRREVIATRRYGFCRRLTRPVQRLVGRNQLFSFVLSMIVKSQYLYFLREVELGPLLHKHTQKTMPHTFKNRKILEVHGLDLGKQYSPCY